MNLSVDNIKKLREQTGAGIADCRLALEESNGDLAKAKQILKQKGMDKAASKSERAVKAGLVDAYIHQGKIGALVTVGCETDFVAKTEEFKTLVHEIAMQVTSMNPENRQELLSQPYIRDASITVGDLIKQSIGKLGENIQVVSFTVSKLHGK